MARKEHHVVPSKDGGWDVKINGAGRRTYHTRKKSTAVKKARAISRKHKSELVIHNSKGRIEVKNSHDVIRNRKPGPKPKKAKTAAKKTVKPVKKVMKKPAKKVTKKVEKKVAKKPAKKAKKGKK